MSKQIAGLSSLIAKTNLKYNLSIYTGWNPVLSPPFVKGIYFKDKKMKKIFIILLLILISNICYSQITDYETPDLTPDEVVTRILEIAQTDKTERTVEEWDELCKLLLYLSMLENEDLGNYIQLMNEKLIELDSKLELYKNYNLELETKIIELKKAEESLNELIGITNQYIEKLLYQIELYQDKIKELESYKNSIVIDIGITHYGALNIELNYFREIKFFIVGFNIGFVYNYNIDLKGISPFGVSFGASFGISF